METTVTIHLYMQEATPRLETMHGLIGTMVVFFLHGNLFSHLLFI